MASCNLSYSGHTSVIEAVAYVYEQTTSGTSRRVRVRLAVYAADYSGNRDSSYSVKCSQSGTDVSVGMYQGFYINGSEQDIFDETFYVSIARGSSSASISLTFKASLYSLSAGATRSISGSITTLNLTKEPEASASSISLGASSVQMGKNLLISISAGTSGCTHTLEYTFGGSTAQIASGVGSSYAWTVPDLASLCNNATSGACVITCKTYLNGSYVGATTASVTLTVQDATTPSVSGGGFTLGTAGTVWCERNSSNFKIRLEYSFYNAYAAITEGWIDSHSWTPPYDLAWQIPNLTYGAGTIICTTLNGTAVVGTTRVTVQFWVPENDVTRPSFNLNGLTLTPVSNLGSDFSGLYLRGKTGVKATFSASAQYSTIAEYSVTVGSASASGNPATIAVLVNDGTVNVTAKVTDARGYSTTVSTTINVLPYRRPKVTPHTGYSDVVCERAKATGELSSSGTYLAIKAGKSYSSVVVNGAEKNGCTLRYRWKVTSAAAFGGWITLLAAGSAETEVSMLISDVVSSLSTSYMVEISVVDSFGEEHTMSFQIMTDAISFVLYDGVDGAGFGKYPEEPHVVDIASHMTLLVRGKLVVVSSDWESLGLASGVEESIYAYGRREASGCHYLVENGNHIHVAFNCAFSYAGTEVVIGGAALPEEARPERPVFALCPVNDRMIAQVRVDTDGYIRVVWVQNLLHTVQTGSAEVVWIDGYIDYFV